MSLSAPFIKRPVATFLLTFGVLLGGYTAYRQLPVASLPAVDFPTWRRRWRRRSSASLARSPR